MPRMAKKNLFPSMGPAMDLQYTQHGPLYIGHIFFIVLFFLSSGQKETGLIFIQNLIENKHITLDKRLTVILVLKSLESL